jgi:hypothetical protein
MRLVYPSKVVFCNADGAMSCEYGHVQAKQMVPVDGDSRQVVLYQRVWNERKQSHIDRDLVSVTLHSETEAVEWVSRINVAFISFE